ncbi:hypothetical protein [Pontibacter burrus]|nr:hypothetical protein [Pontibacter burrus]
MVKVENYKQRNYGSKQTRRGKEARTLLLARLDRCEWCEPADTL